MKFNIGTTMTYRENIIFRTKDVSNHLRTKGSNENPLWLLIIGKVNKSKD